MDRTQRVIKLYEVNSYSQLVNIYKQYKDRLISQNIVWIILKSKNRKFINYLFKQNKKQFSVRQLGMLKQSNINLKYIIDQVKKRMNKEQV